MELWQYPIAIIASMSVALFIGFSSAYLIIRVVYKDDQFQFLNLFYLLIRKHHEILPSVNKPQQYRNESSIQPKSHDLTDLFAPELVFEFECNLKSASQFSGDHILPLQTDVWDKQKESIQELPLYLRSELEQVYSDIKTLNKLIWFSTKVGYQGYSIADYRKILSRIERRSKKIKSVIAFGFPE